MSDLVFHDDTMPDKPLRLLGLPPELMGIIAEHSQPAELKSLRLVNRKMAHRVLRTYCKTFFGQQSILLCDPRSLERVMKIAQHPKLGPHLKQVSIFIEEILCPGIMGVRHEPCECCIIQSSLEVHALVQQIAGRRMTLDTQLLETIFSSLRKFGNDVQIHLLTERSKAYSRIAPPKALAEFKQRCQTHTFGPPSPCDPRPFEVVAKALAASEVRIRSLHVCTDGWAIPLNRMDWSTTCLSNALCNITDLTLTAWIEYCDDGEQIAAKHLTVILGRSRHLQKLFLRMDSGRTDWPEGDHRVLGRYVLEARMPQLRSLKLQGFVVTVQQLRDFSRRHDLLERLDLSRLIFDAGSLDREAIAHALQSNIDDKMDEDKKMARQGHNLMKAARDIIGCHGATTSNIMFDGIDGMGAGRLIVFPARSVDVGYQTWAFV